MKTLVLILMVAAATVVGNAAQAKKKIVYVSFEGKHEKRAPSSADELKEIEALKNLAARRASVNAYHPIQYVVGADD